ncbi:hypothetical protein BH10BAC3_BH10BAC3_41270 [soil metagenome]
MRKDFYYFEKTFIFTITTLVLSTLSYAQNVGIGTLTPAEKLEITGNLRLSLGAARVISVSNATVAGQAGDNLGISAGNTLFSDNGSSGGDLELRGGLANSAGAQAGGNIILTTGRNYWANGANPGSRHGDIIFRGGTNPGETTIVEHARMDGTTGFWGFGTPTPHASLQTANVLGNRRLVLWESENNDQEYFGFGVNPSTLRYQVSNMGSSHIFYAATSATESAELLRIQGNGNVGIGIATPEYRLDVGGSFRANGYINLAQSLDASLGNVGMGGSAFGNVKLHVKSTEEFGLYVDNTAANALALYVLGNVAISGTISKGGGSFKIDHPLDPENKYLSHSFVESPDMMNVYNGNITTDARGEAMVQMPGWFEALNRDFRYQLTVMGQFAQAIVGKKMNNNLFVIKTDKPNVEVSWQVTGIRHDAFANKNRIPVEEEKTGAAKGKYLYPESQGKPADMGVSNAMLQHTGKQQ